MFKIYKFLDSKEKIHFHLLILISVFMNFFEVFSIGMILPILDFLINGKESNLLNNIEKFVPFEINLKSLLIFFISSILLKNIFYLINKYVSVDFSTKITNKVQIKILKTYLKQNLIFGLIKCFFLKNLKQTIWYIFQTTDMIILKLHFFNKLFYG